MKKSWFLTIGLVLVLTMVVLSGCTVKPSSLSGIFSTQQEGICVNGTGKVSVTPDIATIRMGIEAQQSSVAEAQSQATDAMNLVRDALTGNGIAEKDIQTQRFSIHRVTKWNRETEQETVIGYRVTNTVTAKIRDIDNTGIIIDAVARAGGDLVRIDNIAFSVNDPLPYQKEAREKAVADAEEKAKQLARLAGVSLGKPIYISESTGFPPIYMERSFMQAAGPIPAPAPPPISPGELEVSLTVQITYAILE